jgi:tyrosyl-tRNA synthetase
MILTGFVHCCWQVKRLIKGGGVYLNNAKVTDQDKVVQAEDLIDGKLLLLAAGKKNKMLVRISS